MNPVCGKCGDRGFEETLICCFMCQDAYEHRYCFKKASDIFKTKVKWACEDCLLTTIRKKPSPKKIRNLPSRRSERISTKNSPAKKVSPPSAKRSKLENESGDKAEQFESPNSDGLVECNNNTVLKKADFATKTVEKRSPPSAKRTKLKDEKLESLNTDGSVECNSTVLEKNGSKQSLSNLKEVKSLSGGTLWIDLPGSPQTGDGSPSSGLQQDGNVNAQPILDPIWKGSFMFSYKEHKKVGGVAAHLSTLACLKAQQEASLFPVVLNPRIVSRLTVWPKSFQKAEPKGESIGLYFFPEKDRDALAFDSLVHEMIIGDLAMVCVVKNAELLVFTSITLPCEHWRFQGKRYLWGVFRAKQTPSSS